MFGKKEGNIPEEKRLEFLNLIKPIIAKTLNVAEDKINPEAKLVDDLGIDSLAAIELIMAMEEEFKIEILDGAAEKMLTVEDIIQYLAKTILP